MRERVKVTQGGRTYTGEAIGQHPRSGSLLVLRDEDSSLEYVHVENVRVEKSPRRTQKPSETGAKRQPAEVA